MGWRKTGRDYRRKIATALLRIVFVFDFYSPSSRYYQRDRRQKVLNPRPDAHNNFTVAKPNRYSRVRFANVSFVVTTDLFIIIIFFFHLKTNQIPNGAMCGPLNRTVRTVTYGYVKHGTFCWLRRFQRVKRGGSDRKLIIIFRSNRIKRTRYPYVL